MYFDVWLIAALLGCVIGLAVGIASLIGGSPDPISTLLIATCVIGLLVAVPTMLYSYEEQVPGEICDKLGVAGHDTFLVEINGEIMSLDEKSYLCVDVGKPYMFDVTRVFGERYPKAKLADINNSTLCAGCGC